MAFKLSSQQLQTRFETSGGKETGSYHEVIAWWKSLDMTYGTVKMLEMGTTDSGHPLHLVLISSTRDFSIRSIKSGKKAVILINNGIHPGEPDGIDACMLLARDIAQGKYRLPVNTVLAIIPVYNTGGALNRSIHYRVDQNGPLEKGFRGNSRNLDLNRDFIKADARETMSFYRIFHYLDPDVFIDNHVSNGADYQHVMTLIASQHNKLGGAMGEYMNQVFEPAIYSGMKAKGWHLVPYVNRFGSPPEDGWNEFFDSPRYASGYASLWNCFAFVPESHMLKPYDTRVQATRKLAECFIEFTSANCSTIISLRAKAKQEQLSRDSFAIAWKHDPERWSSIQFRGYEPVIRKSEATGLSQLFYDTAKPFVRDIPFYNHYSDTLYAKRPYAFIIPQGWWPVAERLQANNITMQQLRQDTVIKVEWFRIDAYESMPRPYEGHHPNSRVRVTSFTDSILFLKGDYLIIMNQPGNRFLMETLDPRAQDSYFAWNFFDAILDQKEGFSSYAFDHTAAEFLKNNPGIRQALEERIRQDPAFSQNQYAQLDFIFRHSPWFEPSYRRYPVYRVIHEK